MQLQHKHQANQLAQLVGTCVLLLQRARPGKLPSANIGQHTLLHRFTSQLSPGASSATMTSQKAIAPA